MIPLTWVPLLLSSSVIPVLNSGVESNLMRDLIVKMISRGKSITNIRCVFSEEAESVPRLLEEFYGRNKPVELFDDRNVTRVFLKDVNKINPDLYVIEPRDDNKFFDRWNQTAKRRRHFSKATFYIIVGETFDDVTGLFDVLEKKFVWNSVVMKIVENDVHVYIGDFNCKKIQGIRHLVYKGGTLDKHIVARTYRYDNCTLRLATEHWPPYVIKENGRLDGAELKLVQEFARWRRYKLDYVDLEIGEEGIWPAVVDSVRNNFSDLGFCALIISDSLNGTDSTKSYLSFYMSFVVPDAYFVPKWLLSVTALSLDINVAILVTAVVFSWSALQIARRETDDPRYRSTGYVATAAFGTFFGQSLKQPSGRLLRCLFAAWYLYTILINVVFNTALTTSATVPIRVQQIDSLGQLVRTRLPLYVSRRMNFVAEILDDEALRAYLERFTVVGLKNKLDVVRKLSDHRNFSILINMDHIDFLTGKRRGNYHVLPEKLLTSSMAVIIQRGDKIISLLDDFIMKVTESGLVAKWLSDSYIYSRPLLELTKTLPDLQAPLTLRDTLLPFIFIVVALTASLLTLLIELIHHKLLNRNIKVFVK